MSPVPPPSTFEQTLAFHCAPALAGIKPADLISWPEPPLQAQKRLDLLSRQISPAPVRLRLLGRRGGRCLILVYRPDRLSRQLARREVRTMLAREDYPADGVLEAMLDCLASRLAGPEGFPHEIGLFLGYPAGDVEAFRLHRGRDCLYCGTWKVYSDVEQAKRRFSQYRRCQRELYGLVCSGQPLASLIQS